MSQEQKEIKYSSYRVLNVKVNPGCENKHRVIGYEEDCRVVMCDKFLDMVGKEYEEVTGCGRIFTIERKDEACFTEDEVEKMIQTIKDLSYNECECLSYSFFNEQGYVYVGDNTETFTRVCQCDIDYTNSNKNLEKDHELALKVVDALFEIADDDYEIMERCTLTKVECKRMLDLPYLKRCLMYDGPVTKKRKIEEN